MNFAALKRNSNLRGHASARGFTLAEVLAAMLFMAIVIPVTMQGLRIAASAGEVAERKSQASRVADGLLNESLVSSNTVFSTVSGTVVEGTREYRYSIRSEPWNQHLTNQPSTAVSMPGRLSVTQPQPDQLALSQISMNLLTVEVFYSSRGREHSVSLSTLVANQ